MHSTTLTRGPTMDRLRARFQRPVTCPLPSCPAIESYRKESERHVATEATLRAALAREANLVRQKDELIAMNELLSSEAQHRFLNGLQLVTSLLSAQSRTTTSVEAATQLAMAASRVGALGRIHRHLQTLGKNETVKFKHYLEQLCTELSDISAAEASSRTINVKGGELELPSAMAVPLGFIANEMVTNSIKYASGNIDVSLHALPGGAVTLCVSDEGPGLPADFAPNKCTGLGMKIIIALLRQIDGELSFATGADGRGTRFCISFQGKAALDG